MKILGLVIVALVCYGSVEGRRIMRNGTPALVRSTYSGGPGSQTTLVKPIYVYELNKLITRLDVDQGGNGEISAVDENGAKYPIRRTFFCYILGFIKYYTTYDTRKCDEYTGQQLVDKFAEQTPAFINATVNSWFVNITKQNGQSVQMLPTEILSKYGIEEPKTLEYVFHLPQDETDNSHSVNVNIGDLVGEVANAVGGNVNLNKSGILAIQSRFPSQQIGNYLTELYYNVSRLSYQPFSANDRRKIIGRLNACMAFFGKTYIPRRNDPHVSNNDLMNDIRRHVEGMEADFIPTVKKYDQSGFQLFLMGASIHLAMIQEQALVDPEVPSPMESEYIESIREQAAKYVTYAESKYDELKEFRLRQMVETMYIKDWTCWNCINSDEFHKVECNTLMCSKGGQYFDKYTNQTVVAKNNAQDYWKFIAERKQEYNTQQLTALSKEIAGNTRVEGVLAEWTKLIFNPLPYPEARNNFE